MTSERWINWVSVKTNLTKKKFLFNFLLAPFLSFFFLFAFSFASSLQTSSLTHSKKKDFANTGSIRISQSLFVFILLLPTRNKTKKKPGRYDEWFVDKNWDIKWSLFTDQRLDPARVRKKSWAMVRPNAE